MIPIAITPEHADTILAALRKWQSEVKYTHRTDGEYGDIASNGGEHRPLDDFEIDQLCEVINCRD